MSKPVAIIWSRFGPYHLARLDGAGNVLAEHGFSVTGIEVAGTDTMHAWSVAGTCRSADKLTLFADTPYQQVGSRRIAGAVTRALDRLGPACVAVGGWSVPEARAALKWCRRNRAVAVLMSESKEDDAPRSWWKERLKSRLVRQFQSALVGGRPHRDYAVKLGMDPDRVFIGYDVVDNDYFSSRAAEVRARAAEARTALGLPDRYLLAVARFLDFKNLPGLLAGYARYRELSTNGDPWPLVICGSGPLEDELKRQCRARGLDGAVIWAGFKQLADMPPYYALAAAFILPSSREQWGLVLNEAMASGLPVLVSRLAGCRYDLVREGENGWLFDPFDTESMAGAILRMAALPDPDRERMGRASLALIGDWGPERFGTMLHRAIIAGQEVTAR